MFGFVKPGHNTISKCCELYAGFKKVICITWVLILMRDRIYEKKKQTILRCIKKHGRVDHSFILNEVNIDYDTLMKILSELRREGRLG
jgi:hypothetical protein